MERATDAFVIWIDGDAAADSDFAGRIEHVQSAVRGTFESPQELLAFLTAHRSTGDAPGGSGGS